MFFLSIIISIITICIIIPSITITTMIDIHNITYVL